MRTTVLTAFAVAAVASSTLAAPLQASDYEPSDESGAFSLKKLGHGLSIAGSGASVGVPIIGGLIDHFTNKDQQEQPPAPAPQRRSGSSKGAADEIAKAAAAAAAVEAARIKAMMEKQGKGGASGLTKGKSGGRHRRELWERELLELLAREDGDDESGAISWKKIGNGLSIAGSGASVGIPIIGGLIDHFTNKDQEQQPPPAPQRRSGSSKGAADQIAQAAAAAAKAEAARIKALMESKSKGGASGLTKNRSGGRHRRELWERELLELLARDDDDESGAISWKKVGNGLSIAGSGASVGIPIIGGLIDHFTNKDQQPPAPAPQRRSAAAQAAAIEAARIKALMQAQGKGGAAGLTKGKSGGRHRRDSWERDVSDLLVRSLEDLD